MGFGFNTRNLDNDIQKKKPISGLDLDAVQVSLYIVFGTLIIFFVFIANISGLWKIIATGLIISLLVGLNKFYKNRTIYEWLRIFIRKQTKGNISVDRGADYDYFIYNKQNNE